MSPVSVVLPALIGREGTDIGGTASYVSSLTRHLRSRDQEVTVLGRGSEADAAPGFVPLVRKSSPRGRDLSLALLRSRGRWKFPPRTIIHVQRPDHGLGFTGGEWPLVVSFHGLHRRNIATRGRAADWIYGHLTSRVLDRADAIVFATPEDRKEALGTHPEWWDKSRIVPNGIDLERFKPGDRAEARRALGLPSEGVAIGFVGRHAPEKNLGALVEAVERVPGLQLWIAGEGPETERLRKLAGDRVRFLGFLSPEDLPGFHTACHGIALASFHEGLPTVILEAWASGRPVVVPAVTGLRSLLAGGGGLLAARPDAEALGEALGRFLESHEGGRVPEEWGEEVLRRRARPYAWETVTDSMLEIYREVREKRCGS